jgi:hypothetical protein
MFLFLTAWYSIGSTNTSPAISVLSQIEFREPRYTSVRRGKKKALYGDTYTMGNQQTPFVDPERRHTDQTQMVPQHMPHGHRAVGESMSSLLPSVLLLLLGYLVLALLYGVALLQLGLLNGG